MIELNKLYIPLKLDYKSEKGTITFRKPDFLSEDYIKDSECSLQLNFDEESVFIDYYNGEHIYLSELLGLNDDYIAHGNLRNEKFETIQERALKVLSDYIDESQQELFEHFDRI